MPIWKRKQAASKPVANTTPAGLRQMDNDTLLQLEREARKSTKQAAARTAGAASKLLYKAPIAVVSIARAGLAAHSVYVTHSNILAEVTRRGLVPLAQTPDENLIVLVAGQLVAVAVGHKLGEKVAASVVEPLVTHFGGIAVEQMTQKFTEMVVENAAENLMSDAAGGGSSGGTAINAKAVFNAVLNKAKIKIPGFNAPAAATAPTLQPPQPSVSTFPTNFEYVALPATTSPPPSMSRTKTLTNQAISMATSAFATASSIASSALSSSAKAAGQTVAMEKYSHYSGEWVGFGEELDIVVVDAETYNNDIEIKSVIESLHEQPESDDKGNKKTVTVLARYRMNFNFNFNSSQIVTGHNKMDNLAVNGVIDEPGFHVDFGEVATGSIPTDEVQVVYRGRIGGGQLIGEWISSDGRQGLFRLKHTFQIKKQKLMAAAQLEASLDGFISANSQVLASVGMPRRLWASIWGRIEAGRLGSRDPTAGENEESNDSKESKPLFDLALVNDTACVVAARALPPRAAVVVYPHEWIFESREQARAHLAHSPGLVSACLSLLRNVNAIEGIATPALSEDRPASESNSNPNHAVSELAQSKSQYVLDNLHRIAYSYAVKDPVSAEISLHHYCIVTDEFAPPVIPVAQSAEPILSPFVFIDQRDMKPYTVFYPAWIKKSSDQNNDLFSADDDDEDTIPQSYVITRGFLQPFSP
ncbi:hypothetical protein HK100_009169 [Physocladia obscura]|uniref:Uncharacterized protein n=1 Tax=Physocladia obscura TaxID=109957 RepID=A0AAD5T9H8_9FUNG|nr:hypothetical protein HK100_009169 [Physocladia obscura]